MKGRPILKAKGKEEVGATRMAVGFMGSTKPNQKHSLYSKGKPNGSTGGAGLGTHHWELA